MFSVNMPFIDNQHKKLLDIANDCHKAINDNKAKESIFLILNSLIKYAEQHFRDEEKVMKIAGYPSEKIDEHIRIHEQLVTEIFNLHQEYRQSEEKTIHELELFLNNWLIKHILTMDKEFAPYCKDIQDIEL